ncbi:adenosylcobinamide-GDP ribazoletransferase [Secundilactobacillus kimchicus]|uniref:adenosylcobinamide-GDP ribazoletransferase n=1 Tax=Secundilactobacillus kimchicus TaxID=528209 RepID=UPI0006CFCD7A|nr:adenosylcobinamide-GDP ribazoletransferase [Secundilactobacillus kimchicus]
MTLFKSMVAYFRFFTRIYIPGDLGNELYYLNHGSKFLPVFGLLIGLIEASIYYLCALVVHAPLAFMVVLLADVCLTGAMHQDGFADLSDGIFSSRKQDRMLEIMKDSRLGTMGALALIFLLSIYGWDFYQLCRSVSAMGRLYCDSIDAHGWKK